MVGGLLGESGPWLAWAAFAIAALALLLDGVDGWLARRGGWCSTFGARFDMETDALLVLLMAALVWQFDKAGAWVLLAGAMRYLFVAAGLVLPWMRRPLPDSYRRKTVCVIQILTLLVALSPVVTAPLSGMVVATGLALLAGSFLADVVWLRRVADQPVQGDTSR
jgi:phosphatidylglycerophosphate synthase